MMVSIILVSYNTSELTRLAIETLQRSVCTPELQIIVIDNASRDDSVQMLRTHFPQITLITNNQNVGFGRANNQALPLLKGEYVLLLNTDAFVAPDTIEKTVDFMQKHPQVGILGVKLIGRDKSLQPSCRYFPNILNLFLQRAELNRWFPMVRYVDDMAWDHTTERQCDWVPGCYYLLRKQVIEDIGLFDPRYFLYYEEVDHCWAAKRAGWQVMYFPGCEVVHIGGESAKSDGEISQASRQLVSLQIESEYLFFRKNYGILVTIAHGLLQGVADIVLTLKDLLKFRPLRHTQQHLRHILMLIKIAFTTKLGQHPTK